MSLKGRVSQAAPACSARIVANSLSRTWLSRRAASLSLHSPASASSCATCVDPALFAGTCYRAANWIEVGTTRGFGRVRGTLNYARHGRPETVFVRPLRRHARR